MQVEYETVWAGRSGGERWAAPDGARGTRRSSKGPFMVSTRTVWCGHSVDTSFGDEAPIPHLQGGRTAFYGFQDNFDLAPSSRKSQVCFNDLTPEVRLNSRGGRRCRFPCFPPERSLGCALEKYKNTRKKVAVVRKAPFGFVVVFLFATLFFRPT